MQDIRCGGDGVTTEEKGIAFYRLPQSTHKASFLVAHDGTIGARLHFGFLNTVAGGKVSVVSP